MKAYLGTFHDEYVTTVERYIPSDRRKGLIRYSLLPTSVVGYVSTQLGAGYEYVAGDLGVSIRRSSKRVEELFVGGPSWLSRVGPMFSIGGWNTGIQGLTIEGAFPFRFVDESADIYFYEVRFKAGLWKRDVLYAQLFADRREEAWSETQAVRRAKDEVLAALFDIRQSAAQDVDFGTYLQQFKARNVLILGDFRRGRDRLEAIREELAAIGYSGVLLDEIPEVPDYDLRQKFQAIASVCRFLVFEDSTPSGHIGEMFLAGHLDSIRIVLREGEQKSTFVTQGMGLTSKVVREWRYDASSLSAVLAEAVAWAESLVGDLAEKRRGVYPWRTDS
jgi:hypothetical protein